MIVCFECADGSYHEAFMWAREAPRIGEKGTFEDDEGVMREGVRIPTIPGQKQGGRVICKDYQFVSRQPRKWHPAAKHHTKEGHAAFHSQKDATEFVARARAMGEDVSLG